MEVVTSNISSAGSCPDLGLLKSLESIPLGYNIYFSGWNRDKRSNWPSDEIVTIHHPQGDLKKVSKGEVVGTTAAGKCYEVEYNLGLGIVEGGSSGAPSFDENHRVVAIQSSGALTCEESEAGVNQGNIEKAHESGIEFDWYTYLGGGKTLNGIDPIGICQEQLEIFGNLYPGNDWQKKNAILIQAASSIVVSPNNMQTTIQQTPSYMTVSNLSDYTFRAGSSVKFMTGFKIEYGNRLLANISSCEVAEGCGLNFEPVPENVNTFQPLSFPDTANFTTPAIGDLISIYPNPSRGLISVNLFTKWKNVKCVITSFHGKVIWSQTFIQSIPHSLTIDLSNEPSGMYHFSMETEKEIVYKKFTLIKE
ncbi:MAG: T9SS type A sorting domain-containing protein [Bacteroidia bacterium]